MFDVKKGLLCLLFGGTIRDGDEDDDDDEENNDVQNNNNNTNNRNRNNNKKKVHQRGDINILLCGDPGK